MMTLFTHGMFVIHLQALERLRGKSCYTAGSTALPFAPPVFAQVTITSVHTYIII